MTTKQALSREQRLSEVKELIANAEEWAGCYEHPIHDKPQREMFEGMARVMTEHLALLEAMDAEPVVSTTTLTTEHQRVIEMLLTVCGAAFELADDSCQQEIDGEMCHVVPFDAFHKLSDRLDEIENTLSTEDTDRPDVYLAWAAMPRCALKSILHPAPSVPAAVPVVNPVSFDVLRDAVAEVTGGIPLEWSGGHKGHHGVPFMNFNSLARIVNKFSSPPLPAVPDEIVPDNVPDFLDSTANPDEYACCVGADMWNKCRAAMLDHIPGAGNMVNSTMTPAIPDEMTITEAKKHYSGTKEMIVSFADGCNYMRGFMLSEQVSSPVITDDSWMRRIKLPELFEDDLLAVTKAIRDAGGEVEIE